MSLRKLNVFLCFSILMVNVEWRSLMNVVVGDVVYLTPHYYILYGLDGE
jgi:hypothetical protein